MSTSTARVVLDASALLSYLLDEVGANVVTLGLLSSGGGIINTVNYAEVLTRLQAHGEEPADAHARLQAEGLIGTVLALVPVSDADAVTIARLRPLTRAQGLSLGDRACLATALRFSLPVLTADRNWAAINVGVDVRLIR